MDAVVSMATTEARNIAEQTLDGALCLFSHTVHCVQAFTYKLRYANIFE